jgi:hypothetical protein
VSGSGGHFHTRTACALCDLRAERDRLGEEVKGWRRENDRHRDLYVDASKERDRLRAVAEAAGTLITELDANPIGEYGDAVCEAIDLLDAKLKALDAKEGT